MSLSDWHRRDPIQDPNDPSTFPTEDPYATSAHASTGNPPTEHTGTGFVSNDHSNGYQPSFSTNQNPTYRGAPEL